MTPANDQSSSDAGRIDEIVITGMREGDAAAIMAQRNSMNVMNNLSAESFGDISDGNPAEFIKYMPGVDTDGTTGSTISIQLRGMPAQYTAVTLNGVAMTSADANTGSGSSRTFSFEQMSLGGVDAIEISKTTSADMDANAPAGTVNIRTERAFSRKRQNIKVQISGSTHNGMWDGRRRTGPQSNGFGSKILLPNMNATYANSFFNNRLGVAASIGKTKTYIEREQLTVSRNYVPTANSPTALGITAIEVGNNMRLTERFNATLSLDFQATDNLILAMNSAIYRGSIWQATREPKFTTGMRSRGVEGDPYFDFTTKQTANALTLQAQSAATFKKNHGSTFIPSLEWTKGPLKLEANGFYSESKSWYDTMEKGQIASLTNAVRAKGNFSANRSDDLTASDWHFTQLSGADWSDADSFAIAGTEPLIRTTSGNRASVNVVGGAINLSYDTNLLGAPITFKTGGKIQEAEYKYDNLSGANLYTYIGDLTNEEFLRAVGGGGQYPLKGLDTNITTIGGSDVYSLDHSKLYDLFVNNPDDWTSALNPTRWYDSYVANDRRYKERTTALYAMGTADLNHWIKLRAGLRWERTDSTSVQFDPLSVDEVRAGGFEADDETGRATSIEGLEYQYFSRDKKNRKSHYDYFFPSASLKLALDDQTDLHFGYSRTIQRPEVNVLAGTWSYNIEDQIIRAPNEGLTPSTSNNFSARLARYYEPVGLLAVNFYMNTIKGMFQSQELTAEEFGYTGTEYADYTFITTSKVPGDAVNIKGVEIEVNHSLNWLPKPLDGFTIRGSFMYNKPDQPIVRVANKVLTGVLAYRKGPLRLNLMGIWTGDKYRSTTPSWFEERVVLDMSGSYRLTGRKGPLRSSEFFFSVKNLLNKNLNVLVPGSLGADGTLRDHSAIDVNNGRQMRFGLRARF